MDLTDGLSPSSEKDGSLRNTTRNSVCVCTGNSSFSFLATLESLKFKSAPVRSLSDGPALNK